MSMCYCVGWWMYDMHLLVAALEHAQFTTSASNLELSACSTQQQLLVPNLLLSQTVHNNPGEVVQGASAACVHDVPTGRLVQCTAGHSLHKAQPLCRPPAVPPPPPYGRGRPSLTGLYFISDMCWASAALAPELQLQRVHCTQLGNNRVNVARPHGRRGRSS